MNTCSKVGTVAVGALACVGAFFLHRQIKRQQLFARVAKEHVDLVRDVLYTEDEIRTRAAAMAAEISAYYRDKLEEGETLMVVGLLKGALPFMHELVSHLTIPVLLDYIAVHSYGAGTTSSDEYNFRSDTLIDPAGKHVLVVDDILDTGGTLDWVRTHVNKKKPKSFQSAVMLDKKERRNPDIEDIQSKWVGWDIENKFVVGFGLDFDQAYRNIPFVAVLDEKAYKN